VLNRELLVIYVKRFRVFIPEPEWPESHRVLEEVAEVVVGEPGAKYSEELLANILKDFDAVIITSQHRISRRVIYESPRLKVIGKYGSKPGADNVDLAAATERGYSCSLLT
jgi:D-3-phosphoglycerate dehydrogenase